MLSETLSNSTMIVFVVSVDLVLDLQDICSQHFLDFLRSMSNDRNLSGPVRRLGELSYRSKRRAKGGMGAKIIWRVGRGFVGPNAT